MPSIHTGNPINSRQTTSNQAAPLLQWKQYPFFERTFLSLPYSAYVTSPHLQYSIPASQSQRDLYESFGEPDAENVDEKNDAGATGQGMMGFWKKGFLGFGGDADQKNDKGSQDGLEESGQRRRTSAGLDSMGISSRSKRSPSPIAASLGTSGPATTFQFPPLPPASVLGRTPPAPSIMSGSSSPAFSKVTSMSPTGSRNPEFPLLGFLADKEITSWTSTGSWMFLGDAEGVLHVSGPSSSIDMDPATLIQTIVNALKTNDAREKKMNMPSDSKQPQKGSLIKPSDSPVHASDRSSGPSTSSTPGNRTRQSSHDSSFSATADTAAGGTDDWNQKVRNTSPPSWIHASYRPGLGGQRILCVTTLDTTKSNTTPTRSGSGMSASGQAGPGDSYSPQTRRSGGRTPSNRAVSRQSGNAGRNRRPSSDSLNAPSTSSTTRLDANSRRSQRTGPGRPGASVPNVNEETNTSRSNSPTSRRWGAASPAQDANSLGAHVHVIVAERDPDTTAPILYVVQFTPALALLDSYNACVAASQESSGKQVPVPSGVSASPVSGPPMGTRVQLRGVVNRTPFKVVRAIKVGGLINPKIKKTDRSTRAPGVSAIAAYEHAPNSHLVALGLADGTILLLKGDILAGGAATSTSLIAAIANPAPKVTSVSMVVNQAFSSPPTVAMVPVPGTPLLYGSGNGPASAAPTPQTAVIALNAVTISTSMGSGSSTSLFGGGSGATGGVRQSRLFDDPNGNVVTGLSFVNMDEVATEKKDVKSDEQGSVVLYAVTTGQVLSFQVLGKDSTAQVLEHQGSGLHCSAPAIQPSPYVLALGRSEAVYLYNPSGRGPCYVLPSTKTLLTFFKRYLVILTHDPVLSRHTVTCHDLKHRFVAYQGHFSSVTTILPLFSSLLVVTPEGKVMQLRETDIYNKLDILMQRDMYTLALALVKDAQELKYDDGSSEAEVHRKYGEFLHGKMDYEGSMKQFIMTIGFVEPSYVIRKFLDSQLIQHLTNYLQALHARGEANGDHTTLLLNCYTKLKDLSSLDTFLKSGRDVTFDVETAIKVCRQAGYYDHALYLAEKFEGHDWYLTIQIEDVGNHKEGLEYMNRLPTEEAGWYFKKYGSALISRVPEEATELLTRLCVVGKALNDSEEGTANRDASIKSVQREAYIHPEDFIHLYQPSQSQHLTQFLENILTHHLTTNTKVIYNALLELYLSLPQTDDKSKRLRYSKVMDLLNNPDADYDVAHAMALCKTHDLKAALLTLYEKIGLDRDILQLHMDAHDDAKVIEFCMNKGGRDIYIWTQVLTYFSEKREDVGSQIQQLLAAIERDAILSPLQVTTILTRPRSTVKLGTIKPYLIRRLRVESELIEEDTKLAQGYMEETAAMRAEIEELTTKPVVFQVSSCTACGRPLEIPAVHFLCRHSYHLACLNDNEQECPKCGPKNRMLLEIKRGLEETDPEQFWAQMEEVGEEGGEADEGFKVVADWFSKKRLWKSEMGETP